jgi:bifunctional DNase/RNase
LWIPNPTRQGSVVQGAEESAEIPVEVERIIFSSNSYFHVVIVRETDGPRRLSFATGYSEVVAIWHTLKSETFPRPLTHQAWLATVTALGATVQSVCVHARQDETYLAEVRLLHNQSLIGIDVRPSDGLLIALQAKARFLFTDQLLTADAVSGPEPAN